MPVRFIRTIEMQNGAGITGLPNPVNPSDAVNLGYASSLIEGLKWKNEPCQVVTTSNINLASPGATLAGQTMVSGNRVLVLAQTLQPENGIYVWNGPTTPMTRSLDANTFTELENAIVVVTSNNSQYRQTQIGGTLGTSNIIFTPFGSNVPDASELIAGKIEIATQSEVNTGTSDSLAITPLKLANYTGLLRKAPPTNIGDGSATSFTINHNLNTRDVQVTVYANSGNFDDVFVEITRPTVNSVNVIFDPTSTAPAINAFRVVVIG